MREGSTLETIENQTQPGGLYSELPKLAEEGTRKRGAVAVFEVVANLAVAQEGTPSLLDDEDDDKTHVRQV